MPDPHQSLHDSYLNHYLDGRAPRIIGVGRVEMARRRDGGLFPIHLTVADISDETGIRFVGVVRDLSPEYERRDLEAMAFRDSLTGLPNRSFAEQELQHQLERAAVLGGSFALLFVDLDEFKQVNDTLGHAAGDALLREAGQRLKRAVSADDLVARLGGDEFLVLLQGVDSRESAAAIAARIAEQLGRPALLQGQALSLSASIGWSVYRHDGIDAASLMHKADLVMYQRKRQR